MESSNVTHGTVAPSGDAAGDVMDLQKDIESTDFEYVSKTDLPPSTEPTLRATDLPAGVSDFNADSCTTTAEKRSATPPDIFSNFGTAEPAAFLAEKPLVNTSADLISMEANTDPRPVTPISLLDEDKFDEGADDDAQESEEEKSEVMVEVPMPSVAKPEPVVAPKTVPTPAPALPPAPASERDEKLPPGEINEPIELFCKMGLDAWFNPERLHPKVVELVYWRDPKKSGIVLGSGLGVLLSLSVFSLISVVAYLSLLLLTGTICFRVYKNVLQAVQKTSDGHPFKDILELDLTLPQEKVREVTDVGVAHVNAAAQELRRLFLVEDLVDSIKFAVLLWSLTYLGSWFNGMTLIIIAFVAMFTLPKVYENNKSQIDQNLDIVRAKLADISAKVKAAVPIGKKPAEEKKEQ